VLGSGVLCLSSLILSPLLLHKKTEPDPQTLDEKEMDLTLISEAHGGSGDKLALAMFLPLTLFLEGNCYGCISLTGAMR